MTAGHGAHLEMWRTANINRRERAGRVLIGLAAILAGAVLLTTAASPLMVVLELLLIAAGLDLLVTGATGHCPLYQKLWHVPKSLRSARWPSSTNSARPTRCPRPGTVGMVGTVG
jgi:DUF2892 family protein